MNAINRSLAGRARIFGFQWAVAGFAIAPLISNAGPISLVPEKGKPIIADRQDSQTPDRVHLNGWIGTRVEAGPMRSDLNI